MYFCVKSLVTLKFPHLCGSLEHTGWDKNLTLTCPWTLLHDALETGSSIVYLLVINFCVLQLWNKNLPIRPLCVCWNTSSFSLFFRLRPSTSVTTSFLRRTFPIFSSFLFKVHDWSVQQARFGGIIHKIIRASSRQTAVLLLAASGGLRKRRRRR